MIRPIDLQNTILSAQGVPPAQRAEVGSRIDAQATQAAFAAEVVHRDESVAPTTEVLGNRIGAKPDEGHKRDSPAKHKPRTPFEQVVDEAAGSAEEPPHIVDFQA